MHVLKVVEERKWCPGHSSLQMLPSAFKLYVKWDFKRKIKKHSLFLKPWTGLRGSRLWLQLCGRLSALPLIGYWNRELENSQVVLSLGRLEVLKLELQYTAPSRNAISGENECVCSYTFLIHKVPVIGNLLRRFQVKFSSVWLWPKIWISFGGRT